MGHLLAGAILLPMPYKSRNELDAEYKEATVALGRYADSLKGVARTSEHQRELERLEKETNDKRRALLEATEQSTGAGPRFSET